MVNKFDFNEKYSKLYNEYRRLYESMLKDKQYLNLSNLTVIELSVLVKENYCSKSKAITRANSMFMREQNLDNLKELLSLYEFIKE